MLFNELQFWIFFAIVAAAYIVLPHRAQNRMLLLASYVFYGAWDWRFLSLILFSTVVDWLLAMRMDQEDRPEIRRSLLTISLVANLGLLGFFKYMNFFADSFTSLLNSIGIDVSPITLNIILPVGISFYAFQTLSYTIDVYRRRIKPEHDFLNFALFVAFFPQLVAGPIERARNLLPEIAAPRVMTWDAASRGAVLCLLGLIKKIVIADAIAPLVDSVYAAADPLGAEVVLATWLFAVQIYCDFSGYTDIARGVAMILGFGLMRNFAQPYFSTNPQEFWRRWHISLSTWLKDYLYISLGGNRQGRLATYCNLLLTMLLGGLWHGAAWNFVLWGAYQGVLLALHRAIAGRFDGTKEGRPEHVNFGAWRMLQALAFFQIVSYGWLLFRATSFQQIVDFTMKLGTLSPAQFSAVTMPAPPFPAICGIALVLAWDLLVEGRGDTLFYRRIPRGGRAVLYAGMIYLLAFGATTATSSFIYFQF